MVVGVLLPNDALSQVSSRFPEFGWLTILHISAQNWNLPGSFKGKSLKIEKSAFTN